MQDTYIFFDSVFDKHFLEIIISLKNQRLLDFYSILEIRKLNYFSTFYLNLWEFLLKIPVVHINRSAFQFQSNDYIKIWKSCQSQFAS